MLSASQIEAFHRDGFLLVDNVIDSRALAAIRDSYARRARQITRLAVDSLPPSAADGFEAQITRLICEAPDLYQHLDISLPLTDKMPALAVEWERLFGPAWREEAGMHADRAVFENVVAHPNALAIARDIVGPEIACNPTQHVRIKPPQHLLPPAAVGDANVSRTLWHQDEAVLRDTARDTEVLTIWLAVSDATIENGCMFCLPGSHLRAGRGDLDLALHCPGKKLAAEIYIPDSEIPPDKVIPLEIAAGGAVVLHRRCAHGAGENRSQGLRWSFDLRYQRPDFPSGRECFPLFLVASAENPQAVCADADEWRRGWMQARNDILADRVEAVFNERWNKNAVAPLCA